VATLGAKRSCGSIVPNSSAAEVLQVGDKILQVDGKPINSFEDFQRIVASKKVGMKFH